MRNETLECIAVRDPKWKSGPAGIRGTLRSLSLQLKLGKDWCPQGTGVDQIHVPSGEMLRLWIEPGTEYQTEQLERICHRTFR